MFVAGPDKKIKMQPAYPMTTGRNFGEVLRVMAAPGAVTNHGIIVHPFIKPLQPAQWPRRARCGPLFAVPV